MMGDLLANYLLISYSTVVESHEKPWLNSFVKLNSLRAPDFFRSFGVRYLTVIRSY